MNIFWLSKNIKKCAIMHCDKHVVKMILETAMMLCTVLQLCGQPAPYRAVFPKHPCTKWAMASLSNWRKLRELGIELNKEYRYRYNKKVDHKCLEIMLQLEEPKIPDIGLTPFAQAMPGKYKGEDSVKSYRRYYAGDKFRFATWKKRPVPEWFLPLRTSLIEAGVVDPEESMKNPKKKVAKKGTVENEAAIGSKRLRNGKTIK